MFVLNIPGKLLHQRQTTSTETVARLKFPAVTHTFNNITTLKIVFVQSIVWIKCGSMRVGIKKKNWPYHDNTNFRGKKGQENNWR